jgi:hypothetical protein
VLAGETSEAIDRSGAKIRPFLSKCDVHVNELVAPTGKLVLSLK